METEAKDNRRCSACRYYKMFYSKCAITFFRERSGYCGAMDKSVAHKGSCEHFKFRTRKEKNVTTERIDEVISEVEELLNIME